MERKLTTKPASLLLYLISFFKSSSLFFLISHSWTTSRFTHNHLAGAATRCSIVSVVNWSKNLFSPRLQGSCTVKQQLKHIRLQWQQRYKSVEKTFHATACKSCPFFVYCLQHSPMVIQKVAVKAVNPQWLLLTGWAEIPSYSQNELLPLNTEEELSRVRTLPTVSSHQGLQLLHSSHSLTALGAQTLPRENCPAPGTGCSSRPDFPPENPCGIYFWLYPLCALIPFANCYQPLYPSVALGPALPFNVALKGCSWCI